MKKKKKKKGLCSHKLKRVEDATGQLYRCVKCNELFSDSVWELYGSADRT